MDKPTKKGWAVFVAVALCFWIIFDNLALGIIFGLIFGAAARARVRPDGDQA